MPDIEEISEDDLPTREVVRTEIVYEDRYIEPAEPTWGERLAEGTANVIVDILTDPEVQESIGLLFKALWHYKVKPKISSAVQRMKEASKGETKASKLVAAQPQKQNIRYEFEMTNENAEKVVVSGETAEKLVMAMRQKAKELSAMIFLLSNIEIKDEKSESEYMLEQSYIKELVSEEAEHTMRVLVANKQILDKETVKDFDAEYEHPTKYSSGRGSYVERNQAMIDDSDICVFYFDENYLPPRRKNSPRDISDCQPKSGTKIAFDYAKRKKKHILNVFTTI